MRYALGISLALLVCAAAVAADTPIPQDTVRIEKHRRDRLEWNRRMLQGAYDKVGKKDPRWNEPARKALDLAARMFSLEVDPVVTLRDIATPAKAAIDAGCDDPLVVFLYTHTLGGPNGPGADDVIRRVKDATKALAASQYPALRRMVALKLAGFFMLAVKDPSAEVKKEAERNFDAALALLDESVARDERNEFWEDRWLENLIELVQAYRKLGVAAPAAYRRVDSRLAKLPQVKVLRLLVRGRFWYEYGWEARTNAVAAAVPEEAFEAFGKRLEVAQEAFTEAWQLRSGDRTAATHLLEIDKSIGGDRATMELWFDRAMKADGDNYAACATKLDWLDPKWHGNVEEMLAFGHACRDTKNWRVGITMLAVDAYLRYIFMLDRKDPEVKKYLSKPELWSDIQSITDDYLKHYPDNAVQRSKYAMLAYMTGHYPEAHAQFVKLGDRLTVWSGNHWKLEFMKECRDHTEQVVTGKSRPNPRAGWAHIVGKNNEGEWSFAVPANPERTQEAGMLGAKARNVWTCTAEGITYTVRVQLIPPAARSGEPKALLDSARTVVANERGGKARDAHPATLAEHPAQEYLIDAPALRPKVVRVRTGIIGNRIYELSVTATEADVSGASATSFLDSFKFQ